MPIIWMIKAKSIAFLKFLRNLRAELNMTALMPTGALFSQI